jgi:hypothetical protein
VHALVIRRRSSDEKARVPGSSRRTLLLFPRFLLRLLPLRLLPLRLFALLLLLPLSLLLAIIGVDVNAHVDARPLLTTTDAAVDEAPCHLEDAGVEAGELLKERGAQVESFAVLVVATAWRFGEACLLRMRKELT